MLGCLVFGNSEEETVVLVMCNPGPFATDIFRCLSGPLSDDPWFARAFCIRLRTGGVDSLVIRLKCEDRDIYCEG